MNILFVTSAYTPNYEDELRNNCRDKNLQNAANTFQTSVIDGLVQNNIDFEVVSFPGLPSWPIGFSSVYTKRRPFLINEKIVGISEKYLTAIVFKRYSIQWRLKKYIKNWIKKNNIQKSDKFAILTYQPSLSFNSPLAALKSSYPNMIITTIVADFNDVELAMRYAKENSGLLKRLQTYIDIKGVIKLYPTIDKYVLLTKAMSEGIPGSENKYIVIEGLANSEWISDKVTYGMSELKTVAYTGQLSSNSCVHKLVDGFMLTDDPSYRLVITGKGLLSGYIYEKAKIDSRIAYMGIVSRDEMLEVQRNATLLVNPRTASTSMTRFSFPSKIMEYMASGTPFLTYKLDGIPDEYYDYCFSLTDESDEALSNMLDEILSLPQESLDAKAEAAMAFIKNNKTAKIQVGRILDLIKQQ